MKRKSDLIDYLIIDYLLMKRGKNILETNNCQLKNNS
jgi:hypothetical protein